jgi:hypothetical protein
MDPSETNPCCPSSAAVLPEVSCHRFRWRLIPAIPLCMGGMLSIELGASQFGLFAWSFIFHRETLLEQFGVWFPVSIMLIGCPGNVGVGVLFLLATRWLWLGQWRRAAIAGLLAIIFAAGLIGVSLYLDIFPRGGTTGDPGSL